MDKEIEQILYQIAFKVASDYQNELKAMDISAAGNLSNVDFEVDYSGNKYTISLILQDYWKYVEGGRLPGSFPNITKLREWISIKPIMPRPMADGKLPSEEQLVYMIGNSIKENGIPAKPALKNALDKNKDVLSKVKTIISDGFNKEIKKMLQELNK